LGRSQTRRQRQVVEAYSVRNLPTRHRPLHLLVVSLVQNLTLRAKHQPVLPVLFLEVSHSVVAVVKAVQPMSQKSQRTATSRRVRLPGAPAFSKRTTTNPQTQPQNLRPQRLSAFRPRVPHQSSHRHHNLLPVGFSPSHPFLPVRQARSPKLVAFSSQARRALHSQVRLLQLREDCST